jgi:hypothetical protein
MNSQLSINDFLFPYFPELPRHEIFERLSTLEQDYYPHLSWQQAQEQVIWRIVQRHQDHRLNFFWAITKNQISNHKAAA